MLCYLTILLIRFVSLLQEFPILSKLDPEIYGSPESELTKECLEHELNGMSLEEVITVPIKYFLFGFYCWPFMKGSFDVMIKLLSCGFL